MEENTQWIPLVKKTNEGKHFTENKILNAGMVHGTEQCHCLCSNKLLLEEAVHFVQSGSVPLFYRTQNITREQPEFIFPSSDFIKLCELFQISIPT